MRPISCGWSEDRASYLDVMNVSVNFTLSRDLLGSVPMNFFLCAVKVSNRDVECASAIEPTCNGRNVAVVVNRSIRRRFSMVCGIVLVAEQAASTIRGLPGCVR